MALPANKIRIGAMVSGRVGARRFAGTVTAATSALITVTGEDGKEREVCPAWAAELIVDGVETPEDSAIPSVHQLEFELKRSMRNSEKVKSWLKTQKEMDEMKMTPEQKVAAMNAAKEERLKHPVACMDCGEEFLRKSLAAKRCDECKVKHAQEGSRARAAEARKAKKAEGKTGVPPVVLPVTGETTVLPPKSPTDTVIANETCRICGNWYFPGVTGVAGECRKCQDKRLKAAYPGVILDTGKQTERTERTICPEKPVPAAASVASVRSVVLIPVKALEQAHGQIQKLWAEIARQQREIANLQWEKNLRRETESQMERAKRGA